MNQNFVNNDGIDKPLNKEENSNTCKIQSKRVNDLEMKANFADRMDKHVYKKHGLNLMIGCGVTYFIVVVLDTIISNIFDWETSSLVQGFVELLKFIISTLIGYVFSENVKKDK